MTKAQELCEFLAWVQDNYTENSDDDFDSAEELNGGGISRSYSRNDITQKYLSRKRQANKRLADIEKLKQARTLLRAKMYTFEDGILEESTELVTDLLRDIIDDLELSGESIIELNKEGGTNATQY